MRYEDYKRQKRNENFTTDDTTGVKKLTAWGCMQRLKIPKGDMFYTEQANIRMNMELPNREDRAEQRLQITLHHFLQKGYRLRPDESLEDFITRSEEDEREL